MSTETNTNGAAHHEPPMRTLTPDPRFKTDWNIEPAKKAALEEEPEALILYMVHQLHKHSDEARARILRYVCDRFNFKTGAASWPVVADPNAYYSPGAHPTSALDEIVAMRKPMRRSTRGEPVPRVRIPKADMLTAKQAAALVQTTVGRIGHLIQKGMPVERKAGHRMTMARSDVLTWTEKHPRKLSYHNKKPRSRPGELRARGDVRRGELSIADAAKKASASKSMIYRAIRRGEIPPVSGNKKKPGGVKRIDLQIWIQRRADEAK